MELLLNTIAQFIQTYGIWFIVADVISFVLVTVIFIFALAIILRSVKNIMRENDEE